MRTFIHVSFAILSTVFLVGCGQDTLQKEQQADAPNETQGVVEVLPASELEWTPLNPARGDQSPQAATLWGDRAGKPATGFLVKFVDGFSSPPHIHNVSYRAVVVKGQVHNDDPEADSMWMNPGSFWTQPAGGVHITAAKGEENIAFVEIDEGPYLVMPPAEAFENGEFPINVEASNVVWLDGSSPELPFAIQSEQKAKLSYLWKKEGRTGVFLKFPEGFSGKLMNQSPDLKAVVIEGEVSLGTEPLAPGSSFLGKENVSFEVTSNAESLVYLQMLTPAE